MFHLSLKSFLEAPNNISLMQFSLPQECHSMAFYGISVNIYCEVEYTEIFILLKGTEDLGWSQENYRYGFNTYIEGGTLWI